MAEHTPGPWEWTKVATRGSFIEGELRGMFGDSPAVYPILNKDRHAIDAARVAVDAGNARLIAAAPKMLAALKLAEAAMGNMDAAKEIRAAIAEATTDA